MIMLVSLLFLGIIAMEVPCMAKNKLWRELVAFSGLLIVGMVYSFGLVFNWQLPNLRQLMDIVFIPVTQYLEYLLS